MATAEEEKQAEDETNPLTEGLERKPVHPTTMVIFGASGDLAKRKLLPAIYNLAHEGALPEQFNLIGVSRGDQSDEEFREEAREAISEFSRRDTDEKVLKALTERFRWVTGSFDDEDMYDALGKALDEFDEEAGIEFNRLFYLSTSPSFFPVISEALGKHGLNRNEGSEVRIIIEKPFGTDLESAKELNRRVLACFDESQVFRIDHYLGKETVQNMLALRFANSLFEPVWNRNYIEQIQITAAEELGVEGRAGYYDSAGALRDLVQNHLLQLLCLLAMEHPVEFAADLVRNEKVKVLQAIRPPSAGDVPGMATRAQ
jgi:glucose-6-phosphate 1-dehydrogenase